MSIRTLPTRLLPISTPICSTPIWAIALLAVAGCLPEEATGPGPAPALSGDAAADDAASSADLAVAGDAGATTDAGPADAGRPGDAPPPPTPCDYPADCPVGDCVGGACLNAVPERCLESETQCPEGETCGGFHGNFYCFNECEAARSCPLRTRPCLGRSDCPTTMSCHDGFCINNCEIDTDCAAGGHCLDGECQPYPAEQLWTGDDPAPLGRPGQLYAGVAVRPFDFVVGVSLAGYASREGPSTPYATALKGSNSVFERQDVRALVLAGEGDTVILLRVPLCWSTEYLRALTALKLQALTQSPDHPEGIDWLDKIVMVATHSHAQPAKYWNIVPTSGFGVFGYGKFSKEMVERYSDVFARTIADALADLRPARFGWTVVEGFDPDGMIHTDRRGESPDFLDDNMTIWRVDDAEGGEPLAAMVSFAIHGTHIEGPLVTGDAPGGVETALTQALSRRAGRFVPVLFANGNAGDVSPRGDRATRFSPGKLQVIGALTWPIFEAGFDAIAPQADVAVQIATRRVPISYELLGYDRSVPEFRDRQGDPLLYGAFNCVAEGRALDDPPYDDGDLDCALNIVEFNSAPVQQFQKATLSAFQLGDLVTLTFPGEPAGTVGLETSAEAQRLLAQAGMEGIRVVNVGYSQDHHFYLLNPSDWLRGGYEASSSIWGWKLVPYLQGKLYELSGQLATAEVESNDNGIVPSWWPDLPDDTVPPTTSASAPGTWLDNAPATLDRGALLALTWNGGHPGVDLPRVHLEQREGAGFVPAERSPGYPLDDYGFESIIAYHGDYQADHRWGVGWEFPYDQPAGTYRVVIEGRAFDGAQARSYVLESDPFELRPATLVLRGVEVVGRRVRLLANYPNGPSTDDGGPFESLAVAGHLLRMDPTLRGVSEAVKTYSFLLGPAVPGALQATLTGAAELSLEGDAVHREPAAVDFALVTSRGAGGEEGTTPIEGWPSTRVEVEVPGPGAYTVTIHDAHGNAGAVDVRVE